ncbi:MAG: hypothetical protein ACYCOU_01400 [Sulfobacillus sp.]
MSDVPFLDINELYRPKLRKEKEIEKFFAKVLSGCHYKIKQVSPFAQECRFQVPRFVLGSPPYNYAALIKFILESLRNNGFYAVFEPPEHVRISWEMDKIDIEKYRKAKRTQFQSTIPTRILGPNVGAISHEKYGEVPVSIRQRKQ